MASFTIPTLTITGSTNAGYSTVTVEYDVTFSTFDEASDQPYEESVVLIGDDPLIDVTLATLVPEPPSDHSVISASTLIDPHRTHTKDFRNTTLDEDLNATDEIRAVVTLTPVPAAVAGPTRSNQVSINLP